MAYQTIDGVKYEKKLSKDEVADLFKSANDGQGVTDTEKSTLSYIRKNYEFTDAAAKDFDAAFASL